MCGFAVNAKNAPFGALLVLTMFMVAIRGGVNPGVRPNAASAIAKAGL